MRELESDAESLKWRLHRLSSKKKAGDPTAAAAKARLEAVEAVLDRVAKLAAAADAAELDALVALWSGERASPSWKEDLDAAFGQWRSLLESVLSLTRENPDLLTMMVVSESPEYLGGLLAAYQRSFDRSRCEVRHPAWLRVGHSKETGKRAVDRVPPRRPERPLEDLPVGAIGALFEVAGPLAALRYGREAGLHLFKDPEKRKEYKCLVDTFGGPAGAYKVPDEAGHKGFVSNQPLRRTYVLGKRIEDELLAKPRRWVWSILRSLGDLVDELYEQELERVSRE